jgi:hypothetical protein
VHLLGAEVTPYAVIVGGHPVCSKECYESIVRGAICQGPEGCCYCGRTLELEKEAK